MDEQNSQPEKPSLPSDEDITARFQRIRDELEAMKPADLPEDLATKASEAGTKPVQAGRMPEVPNLEIPKSTKKPTNGTPGNYNYKSLGIGMSAAYSLVGAMIVGFGLGWVYDRYFHTISGQVIGGLFGSVLGIGSAIFLINRDGGNQ